MATTSVNQSFVFAIEGFTTSTVHAAFKKLGFFSNFKGCILRQLGSMPHFISFAKAFPAF